jgi:hypothetical protein
MAKPKVTLNVWRKVKSLKFWKENPNFMEMPEFDALKKSIEKFGFIEPVIIDEKGLIIGGNHRATAWYQLYGDEKEIPCTVVDGLSKDEKNKLGLALNKIHGQNDLSKLKDLLESMEMPEELLNLGFEDEELKMLDVDTAGFMTKDDMFTSPKEINSTIIICPHCGKEITKARTVSRAPLKREGETR